MENIILSELGVNLKEMKLKLGLEPPKCLDCEEENLLCMRFDTISNFIATLCNERENLLCMVIMMDKSYVCGLKVDGKLYKIGNETLSYKELIPETVSKIPVIDSIVVLQHVSIDDDGACEFSVITK